MKKLIFSALFCIFTFMAAALPSDSVIERQMENGFSYFLLEDSASPLVRIDFSVRAGFSAQTKQTSGFFKLYSRIFSSSLSEYTLDDLQCNADSTRFIITLPPSKVNDFLNKLSETAFSPQFSDDILSRELSSLKTEVLQNQNELSTLINSAIDSRVFSAAPWKHDSGIYPALFNKTTLKNARSILNTISERFYIPQNSAIFISGNINQKEIENTLQNTFGSIYSTYSRPKTEPAAAVNKKRRFVIHDPEFSAEMTQLVVQYTSLEMEQCDVAAALLNNSYSALKQRLLEEPSLNIPGDEYINAAAAHKKDSSRLIIQSLLQFPEDKKSKITSLEQTELFLEKIKQGVLQTTSFDFFVAVQELKAAMTALDQNSQTFMDYLSAFWAEEPYTTYSEQLLENPDNSITAQNMKARTSRLEQVNLELTLGNILAEEPFVFVIINSSDFKKNKKAYLAAGFEEITKKNAPWYSQKIFDENTAEKPQDNLQTAPASSEPDNNYYKKNLSQIKSRTLANGIPFITKQNLNSSAFTLMLSIKGGKINSADNHGFEEVMTNLLANNIQKEIYLQYQMGMILGMPELKWQTNTATSTITVNSEKDDLPAVIKAVSDAIIYGEIIPSAADRTVSARQYKKRLENGSAANQMYAAIIKELYPKTDFPKIFEYKEDILLDTNYQQILEAYPDFLDAARYSIILTGNFDDSIFESVNSYFGNFSARNNKLNLPSAEAKLSRDKKLNVKITHTFLTDTPAEEAGPMPAVLIPTTEFLDPVMYVFQLPQADEKTTALFHAELFYLQKQIQFQINHNKRISEAKVRIIFEPSQTDCAVLVIDNTAHTKEADAAVKNAVISLQNGLKEENADSLIQDIRDFWIQDQLFDAQTNEGTAELLQKGLERSPYENDADFYLEEYNYISTATRAELEEVSKYLPELPKLRAYSKDSKK